MHKFWISNPLDSKPSSDGVSRVDLDESKIIGNENAVYHLLSPILPK